MRKTAHLIAATIGGASLALMSFSSVAANASTSPSTAQPATATTSAAPRAGQVTCVLVRSAKGVPVRSAKGQRLESCSAAVALPAAAAVIRQDRVPASAKVAVSLAASRSALPANAAATSAGVSGGCTSNSEDNQLCTYNLDPGPRQACGGFNGHIQWYIDHYGMEYISTWGEVWSLCAASAYVYLSWQQTAGLCGWNFNAGGASAYSTSGVNEEYANGTVCVGGPSSVHETVCTTEDGGWHCGAGVYV
jgi:hypothetical protein